LSVTLNWIKIFNYLCALDQARFSWICEWTWRQQRTARLVSWWKMQL